MKNSFCKQVIGLLLLTLFAVTNVFAHGEKLAVFVDNSYPPYMYELEESQAEGLYPRLLKAVIDQTGHKSDIFATPWKRALLYGETGVGAVGGAYKNDERLKLYDYSAPLYQEKLVVFINKNKRFDYKGIEDLAGKTIGVNRGWSYGQEFDEARKNKLFEVNVRGNPTENFKMLALGRIDCLILDKLSGDSYVRLLGMGDKIELLPVAFSMNDAYLILSKEKNMKPFLEKFNSSLEKMRQDGTYDEIVQTFIRGTVLEQDLEAVPE